MSSAKRQMTGSEPERAKQSRTERTLPSQPTPSTSTTSVVVLPQPPPKKVKPVSAPAPAAGRSSLLAAACDSRVRAVTLASWVGVRKRAGPPLITNKDVERMLSPKSVGQLDVALATVLPDGVPVMSLLVPTDMVPLDDLPEELVLHNCAALMQACPAWTRNHYRRLLLVLLEEQESPTRFNDDPSMEDGALVRAPKVSRPSDAWSLFITRELSEHALHATVKATVGAAIDGSAGAKATMSSQQLASLVPSHVPPETMQLVHVGRVHGREAASFLVPTGLIPLDELPEAILAHGTLMYSELFKAWILDHYSNVHKAIFDHGRRSIRPPDML